MQSVTLKRAAEPPRPGQDGLAELVLERRAGRTRLTRSRTKPPLLSRRRCTQTTLSGMPVAMFV